MELVTNQNIFYQPENSTQVCDKGGSVANPNLNDSGHGNKQPHQSGTAAPIETANFSIVPVETVYCLIVSSEGTERSSTDSMWPTLRPEVVLNFTLASTECW